MSGQRVLSAPAIPSARISGVLLLGAAATILACAALLSEFPADAAVLGGIALAVWSAALLTGCSAIAGRVGLGLAQWKIGSWFLAWCAVTCGLASTAPRYGLAARILPSSVARAEWLTAVAVTAWAVAYCAGPRRLAEAKATRFMRRLTARRPGTVRGPLVPWLLYGAGGAGKLADLALTGHIGMLGSPGTSLTSASGYQQALLDLTLACPVAVAVAALRLFRERAPGARFTLTVLFATEVAVAGVTGQKGEFVTAVVAVVIGRAAAGRTMPAGVILAAAAFFLLVVIPYASTYRGDIRGTEVLTASQGAAIAPAIGRQALAAVSPATIPRSLDYLGQRLQEIDGAAMVMQETPSMVPYTSPAQIPEAIATALVPRALWPGKPIIDPGFQFTAAYYDPRIVSADAVTPQADLYRYGGWLPLLAGMFLLGCLMRVLDDVLDVRESPPAALLVLPLWPVLATPEGTFTGIWVGLPSVVLLWLAVTAVTFRRVPAAAAPE